VLRPLNFPAGTPGLGAHVYASRGRRKVLVINVMGRLFMDALDDPFAVVERELAKHRMGATVDAVLIDVHAEATSEKMAMAHMVDGRASIVVGTHSHIPTADAQILPGGTAYQTDAGMCGDYDSVIGMKKEISLARFVRKMPGERLAPAEGPATVCGIYLETDDKTGLARRIEPLRLGGRLAPAFPDVVRAAAD
jgi:metallophosphoesterase (TIGR00282 family)